MIRNFLLVLTAFVLAAGAFSFEWFIYKPYVDQGTVNLGGYWSDLYPRWYGTRELLLRHRDPYSHDISQEIVLGYKGRPNADPTADEGVFVYPLFVVIPLSPFIFADFATVAREFTFFLLLSTVLSVPSWAKALRVNLSKTQLLIFVFATLSSFPAMSGASLQQLGLLVPLLLGLAFLCAGRGNFLVAGGMLAVSTLKPQLSILPILLLLGWAAFKRERRNLIWGFALVLLLLWGVSEVLLRGWVIEWLRAMNAYTAYNGPSLAKMLLGPRAGLAFAVLLIVGFVLISAPACRAETISSEAFVTALALGIILELVLTPNAPQALYNDVMLLPIVMGLWKFRERYFRPALKPFYIVGLFWLIAPWAIAAAVLTKAAFKGRPVPPSFAPFNIALFFPTMLLVLILARVAYSRCTGLNMVSEPKET